MRAMPVVAIWLKLPSLWLIEEKDKSINCIVLKNVSNKSHKEIQFDLKWLTYLEQESSSNTRWSLEKKPHPVLVCLGY